ncbi:alpha/beta fold hydrolase [Kitasatospora sp. NPDC051853]|uniref:alpha/beta fold hydrolase n=1 Tax=Kitasatospora sp. NPDC051853 TaxID=3364058 RepID=UPI00378D5113
MPFLPVRDEDSGVVNLYYEDHGSGRPVVLVHGWPLNGASWELQEAALLAAGHRVVTYDRRGFGASDKPSSGYDYDTFAADLNVVLETLDLRDAVLVGFSMGSGEVTRYLGSYGPGRVARAVLLGALPPFPPEAGAVRADLPVFVAGHLADLYDVDVLGGGGPVSDRVVAYSWNVGVAASASGPAVGRTGSAGPGDPGGLADFRTDLPRIRVPVLIVHGDADRALPLRSTAVPVAEAIAGSRLVVLEGAPHGLIWTHAAEVNRELLAFAGE